MQEIYYSKVNCGWYINDGLLQNGCNFIGEYYDEAWSEKYVIVPQPAFTKDFPY